MRNPLIITIGREYGSGGRQIGELVAKTLGIAYYDKKLITQAALLRGQGDELFIVIRDAEGFGDQLADLTAAAAILTANGDD